MKCNLSKVLPNGNESKLYADLMTAYKNESFTERLYNQIYEPDFKEWFGEWEAGILNFPDSIDVNGEPNIDYLVEQNPYMPLHIVPTIPIGTDPEFYSTPSSESNIFVPSTLSKVEEAAKNFAETVGVPIKFVNNLPNGVQGAFNAAEGIISISENNLDSMLKLSREDTILEEVAHLMIELSYQNGEISESMLNHVVTSPMYDQVVEDYTKLYEGKDLDRKIRFEVLGKELKSYLREEILRKIEQSNIKSSKPSTKYKTGIQSFFDWLLSFVKDLFIAKDFKTKLRDIAKANLSKSGTNLRYNPTKASPFTLYSAVPLTASHTAVYLDLMNKGISGKTFPFSGGNSIPKAKRTTVTQLPSLFLDKNGNQVSKTFVKSTAPSHIVSDHEKLVNFTNNFGIYCHEAFSHFVKMYNAFYDTNLPAGTATPKSYQLIHVTVDDYVNSNSIPDNQLYSNLNNPHSLASTGYATLDEFLVAQGYETGIPGLAKYKADMEKMLKHALLSLETILFTAKNEGKHVMTEVPISAKLSAASLSAIGDTKKVSGLDPLDPMAGNDKTIAAENLAKLEHIFGTVDLVLIDGSGNMELIDIKNILKQDIAPEKEEATAMQLSIYAGMLEGLLSGTTVAGTTSPKVTKISMAALSVDPLSKMVTYPNMLSNVNKNPLYALKRNNYISDTLFNNGPVDFDGNNMLAGVTVPTSVAYDPDPLGLNTTVAGGRATAVAATAVPIGVTPSVPITNWHGSIVSYITDLAPSNEEKRTGNFLIDFAVNQLDEMLQRSYEVANRSSSLGEQSVMELARADMARTKANLIYSSGPEKFGEQMANLYLSLYSKYEMIEKSIEAKKITMGGSFKTYQQHINELTELYENIRALNEVYTKILSSVNDASTYMYYNTGVVLTGSSIPATIVQGFRNRVSTANKGGATRVDLDMNTTATKLLEKVKLATRDMVKDLSNGMLNADVQTYDHFLVAGALDVSVSSNPLVAMTGKLISNALIEAQQEAIEWADEYDKMINEATTEHANPFELMMERGADGKYTGRFIQEFNSMDVIDLDGPSPTGTPVVTKVNPFGYLNSYSVSNKTQKLVEHSNSMTTGGTKLSNKAEIYQLPNYMDVEIVKPGGTITPNSGIVVYMNGNVYSYRIDKSAISSYTRFIEEMRNRVIGGVKVFTDKDIAIVEEQMERFFSAYVAKLNDLSREETKTFISPATGLPVTTNPRVEYAEMFYESASPFSLYLKKDIAPNPFLPPVLQHTVTSLEYTHYKPNVQFQSPEYQEVLKYPKVAALYDFLMDHYRDSLNWLPPDVKRDESIIPVLVKGTFERLIQWGADKKTLAFMGDWMKSLVMSNNMQGQYDESSRYASIPMFNTKGISTDDREMDIGKVMKAYMRMAYAQKHINMVEPMAHFIKESGMIDPKRNSHKMLSNFMDSQLYGRFRDRPTASKINPQDTGERVSLDAVVETIMGWTKWLGLTWNLMSGVSNLGFGMYSNFMYGAGGKKYTDAAGNVVQGAEFGEEDAGWATAELLKSITGQGTFTVKQLSSMLRYFRFNDLREASATHGDKAQKLAFYVQYVTENANYSVTLLSILRAKGHMDKISFTGLGNDNIVVNLTKEEQMDLQNAMLSAKNAIHGGYSFDTPINLDKNILGRIVLQFRRWLPRAVNNRVRGEYFDAKTNKMKIGTYPALHHAYEANGAKAVILAMINLNGGTQGLKNKPHVKAALRQLRFELATMVVVLGALYMLRAAAGEADDEEARKKLGRNWKNSKDPKRKDAFSNWAVYLSINVLGRLSNDILLYYDPDSMRNVLDSPAPMLGTLDRIYNVFKAMGRYIEGEDELKKGPNKGHSNLARKFGAIIPMWASLSKLPFFLSTDAQTLQNNRN